MTVEYASVEVASELVRVTLPGPPSEVPELVRVTAPRQVGAEVFTGVVSVIEREPNTVVITVSGGKGGPQGVKGDQGPQGVQGEVGSQGPQGDVGAQGSQGVLGAQGTTGSQGPTGVQGAQGSTGPQGSTGAQGLRGFQGLSGPQGFQGTQGHQGVQGVQGTQGSQGTQGLTGTTGAQGVLGSQGAQGSQGATGTQGPQGYQGVTGPQGVQGAASTVQGPQGAQGSQGATGAGTQGVQGAQGYQGLSGQDAGKIFYLATSDASDIATYKTGLPSPSAGAEQTIVTVCPTLGVDVLVATFATDPGVPGVTDVPAGTSFRRMYAATSPASLVAKYHVQVYKRDLAGTETLIRDEYSQGFTNVSVDLVEWLASSSVAGTLLVTDRLVIKIYAQRFSGGTTSSQVTTYFEGSTHASQVQSTISAGSSGPQGTQGAQGSQGSQGAQGVAGPQGSTGTQGPQGATGTGTQGPQGATGAGTQGPQGAQGPQGSGSGGGGAQGPQGDIGTQGPQGATGASPVWHYTFDPSPFGGAPSDGCVRLNNANYNSATIVAIDADSAEGDIIDWLLGMLNWTGLATSRGQIRLQSKANPQRWVVYDITGITNNTTDFRLNVTALDSANGFTTFDDTLVDDLQLSIVRTGAAGAQGSSAAWHFTFDTSVGATPGSTGLTLNNSNYNSATSMKVDQDAVEGAMAFWLLAMCASGSTVKAQVKLQSKANPLRWAIYNITAAVAVTSYVQLTIAKIDSATGYTTFATTANDLEMYVSRTGDVGTTGPQGAQGDMGADASVVLPYWIELVQTTSTGSVAISAVTPAVWDSHNDPTGGTGLRSYAGADYGSSGVEIQQPGLYAVSFRWAVSASTADARVQSRILVNGTGLKTEIIDVAGGSNAHIHTQMVPLLAGDVVSGDVMPATAVATFSQMGLTVAGPLAPATLVPEISTASQTGATGNGTLSALPPYGRILSVEYSGATRLRIYRTAAGRSADVARASSSPYLGGAGLLYEYVASGAETDNESPLNIAWAEGETTYYYYVDGGSVDFVVNWAGS